MTFKILLANISFVIKTRIFQMPAALLLQYYIILQLFL